MNKKTLTFELTLYGLAFILALGIRLLNLGDAPLSDFEAGWALQALDISKGNQIPIGPQPAYVLLTSLFFSLFGDANALARLLPALAGSALVLFPLLFSRYLAEDWAQSGHFDADREEQESPLPRNATWLRFAGLIMAFGLALDPGLVTLSRLAGGPMPAITFTLLALALAYQRRAALTGLFAGLALLSGTAAVQGILGLALVWGAGKWLDNVRKREPNGQEEPDQSGSGNAGFLRIVLYFCGGTLLLAGTLFLRTPQGLGALASTLPAYLTEWATPSGTPALRLPVSLIIYQPLALIFGVLGAIRGWYKPLYLGDLIVRRLSLWAVIALVLAMLYPARQTPDVAWTLIPLWALAAFELAHHLALDEPASTRLVALGQAVLLLTLLAMARFNFLSLARLQTNASLYAAVIGGALVMGLVATLLIAAGWSTTAARLGLVWGLSGALCLGLVATSWGASHARINSIQELWNISPATGQANLLLETLGDLSDWHSGQREALEVFVTVEAPSLRWVLRRYSQTRYVTDLTITESPTVIITYQDQETPSLALSYRGQDFDWHIYPSWQGVLPPNVLTWMAFRQTEPLVEQVILWARSDLFPGGELPAPGEVVNPEDINNERY